MIIRSGKENNNSWLSPFMANFFDVPMFDSRSENDRCMKTDVLETEKEYVLKVELPGFTKDQVKVDLEDGYLSISAELTSNENEGENAAKYIRRERYVKSLKRSFSVGDLVDENGIEAKMENGVLEIKLPKKAPVEPEKKSISIM